MKYKRSVYRTFALITQLGLSMITPIFLCVFLAVFLEKKFSISLFIPLVIMVCWPEDATHITWQNMQMKIQKRKRNIKMNSADNTVKELAAGIIVYGILTQIICLVVTDNTLSVAVGLWIGIATALGMMIHMKRSIEDALDFGKRVHRSICVRHM